MELAQDDSLSYGTPDLDNRLVYGDNLGALQAFQEFSGRIKCILLDPPYNRGSPRAHYRDKVDHGEWLSDIGKRLFLMKPLLHDQGSVWIIIGDTEAHYLKVLCDTVFDRNNFVANCVWQKTYSQRMDAKAFSNDHDHVLVYRKGPAFRLNRLPASQNAIQFNYSESGKSYRRRSLRKQGSKSLRRDRPNLWYPIPAPDGTEIWPIKADGTEGRWRWEPSLLERRKGELEFVKKEGRWEIYVKQWLEENPTKPPSTVWLYKDVGNNHDAKREAKAFNGLPFDTPKPERLVRHILSLATIPGDLVLDCYAGSGTTGAVAHKMGRQWIMVENGEQCLTHVVPRLRMVVDGLDPGGISKDVGWKGGGGYRFFRIITGKGD